ncbi:HAD family hydrolase [Parvularcula marina]|uniref:HAD family hydrolase n=1 Tax=Parvularcula marina TaxID=2292771 RepID=A0A371RIE5_9PROT|nr:HAD-IA family hydrolase [Parvularcula marina]RFB05229.1 HAD family hydrolase [Parvularcula marina]
MLFAAILFDCDGVLVDSEIVGLEDVAVFLNERGFDWGPEDLIRRFNGMRADLFRTALQDEYGAVLGRMPSEAEFTSLWDGMIETRRAQRHTMTIVPGALDVVQTARELGYRMAVASSSAQIYLDDKVNRYGLAPYFDGHVYSADFVEHGKPAPDIFLYAAEQLGVDPASCLIIEDSAHGVAAGKAAGGTVWGFLGGGHCLEDHADQLQEAGADRLIETHSELAIALRML